MFQIASLKCSSCNAEIVELLVTGANNVIMFVNTGNNKITELRTILQRESQTS
jgi:hypothetical protein